MGHTSGGGESLLRAAHALLEQRGYAASGLAEICRAAGVPRGSFHYFFASKEELALRVVDEHWNAQRRTWLRLLESGAEPMERLRALCEAVCLPQGDGPPDGGMVSGRMLARLAVEAGEPAGAVRERVGEILDAQVGMVESVLSQARRRGAVSVSDTRESARSVLAQLQGRILFAALYGDRARLGPVWADCLALLGARGPRTAAAAHRGPHAVPV